MAKRIKKFENPLARSFAKVVNGVLQTVVDMDKNGVSEEIGYGELRGKTNNGKDIQVKYGYGIKVGLDDFVKKLKQRDESNGANRTSS